MTLVHLGVGKDGPRNRRFRSGMERCLGFPTRLEGRRPFVHVITRQEGTQARISETRLWYADVARGRVSGALRGRGGALEKGCWPFPRARSTYVLPVANGSMIRR